MVKRTIRNCILSKRLKAVTIRRKFSVDLPEGRTDDSPPSTNTGIDFAGLLLLSEKVSRESIMYACSRTFTPDLSI